MQIEQVRKYVLASLAGSVVLAHSLAVAALGVTSNGAGGSRIGLFVLSIMFGILAVGAIRLIVGRSLLTPWMLAAGVLPVATYVGYFQILN